MGQPDGPQGPPSPAREKQTRGTETSQYPEEEKATAIPLVAASERGPAQTSRACTAGGVGPRHGSTMPNRSGLGRPARERGRPGGGRIPPPAASRGKPETRKPAWKWGGQPPRGNTPL